jgi:hypothetical protein
VTCFPCGVFQGNGNLRVPYLGFANNGLATTITNGDELYNSLQAQVKHNFSHGLIFQLAYTWSKEFTNINSSESGGFLQPNGGVLNGGSNLNSPVDLKQQYGLAAFERPQRVVISFVYNLPNVHREGLVGKALNGWSLSGVTTIQDGQPFSIVDGAGGTIYGAGTARAALVDPTKCTFKGCQSGTPLSSPGSTTQRLGEWFDTSAFISMCQVSAFTGAYSSTCAPNTAGADTPLPASSPYCIGGTPNPGGNPNAPCGSAPGSLTDFPEGSPFPGAGTGYGNSAVGIVFGPGQYNQDAAIVKDTKIWEHGTLQFRAEFFNVWNHAQFNPPGNNVNTPSTFGVVNSTANTPRVVQFALKYMF